MELVIDIIYLIDIYLGFTTSYIDQFTGDEYFGISKIARNYIRHDFIIDFLSTMWFQEFFKYVLKYENQQLTLVFQVFKLLKVLRLRKVSKLIRGANATIETKAFLQVGYFTLILVIYTHVVACIMWHMLKTHKHWTPAVDFGNMTTFLFLGYDRTDRAEWDFFMYQYTSMWYNSALAFMMVEVNARTYTQMCVMVPIYVLNAIINAVLFGVFVD